MSRLEEQKRYAQVLVQVGVQLKPGQALFVEAPVEQGAFVALLAQAAYSAGCGGFGVQWRCGALERVKYEVQGAELPGVEMALAERYAAQGAAYIRLDSPDLTVFAGLSPQLLSQKALADGAIRALFRAKAGPSGQTIACLPSQGWADLVYPELPPEARLDALWDAVLTCVRCKEADPVAAWQAYLQRTTRRKAALDAKGYRCFHYVSGQTDLTLRPAEGECWKGSCIRVPGRVYVPNIPTEEVFLAPHKYGVDGHVAATLPLDHRGQLIEGIRLTLKDGLITEFHADRGEELLKAILDTDEGSRRLGEMALVDQASPIARLGRIFYTTLYDENTSCHMAIGNALGPVRDPEERERRGLNTSQVHVDFMVGSDDMSILGQRPDGSWEPIFEQGHWALEETEDSQ